MERILNRIEQISLTIDFIRRDGATQIIDAVNRRVRELLACKVIRVYWRAEAETGVILQPVTLINDTPRDDPRPFQIVTNPNGMISWVYFNRKPLWFERIRNQDKNKGLNNEVTGEEIPRELLVFEDGKDFRYDVDSVMAIPLTIAGSSYGVYTVELDTSGKLNRRVLNLLESLGKHIARLLHRASSFENGQKDTAQAIRHFLSSIRNEKFSKNILFGNNRMVFIARPFSDRKFEILERSIKKCIRSLNVDLTHVKPIGSEIVIQEIMDHISSADLCIADITGTNPNVLAEVGMMMMARTTFMLLRDRSDDGPYPFNVASYNIFEYDLSDGNIRLWSPGDTEAKSCKDVMEDFLGGS